MSWNPGEASPAIPQPIPRRWLAFAILILAGIGWLVSSKTESLARSRIEDNLDAIHQTALASFQRASQVWKEDARLWAQNPEINRFCMELLQAPKEAESLLSHPAQEAVRLRLKPAISDRNYKGFFLIAPDGTSLASSRDENVGTPNPILELETIWTRVLAGETLLTPPRPSEIPLLDGQGRLRRQLPTQFVVTPLLDPERGAFAYLSFRIDPVQALSRILNLARFGQTGETYLFDRDGVMLSSSRFQKELAELGLLEPGQSSVLNLTLRDPGVALQTQKALPGIPDSWPKTFMAETAAGGYSGLTLEGYRNYLGHSVIGVWTWNPQENLGIATEQQQQEAFRALFRTRLLIFSFIGLTVTLLAVSTFFANRANRQALGLLNKIADSENRFRTLVNQAAEAIVLTSPKGRILYVNPAWERLCGYSSQEAVGKYPNMLKSGLHDDQFYAELWKTITSGNVWRGQFTNRHKDGGHFEEEAVISPLVDQNGEIVFFLGLMSDVTQEMEAQQALELSEQQLRQAQKMEAVGRMAGGVAHDFNNLLTAIFGYMELAKKSLDSEHPALKELLEVEAAGQQAADLIRQLMSFSRSQEATIQALDLSKVVLRTQKLLQRMIGEDISLEVNAQEALPRIEADLSQIQQVVMNLVVNARDAMPQGGRILLETDHEVFQHDFVSGDFEIPAGRYTILSVSDSGCGMDARTLEHAFDPFFTTKDVGIGTGLGLSTVYGIVHQGGGHVWAFSEPGEGTIFKIFFPINEEEAEQFLPPLPAESDLRGRETILLVEDEALLRRMMTRYLQSLGYRVFEASHGFEALATLDRRKNTSFDLILSDVVLPALRGPEMVSRALEIRPQTKVLLISGYPIPWLQETMPSFPENDPAFLQKPFSFLRLGATLRKLLDQDAPQEDSKVA
ncbi:MAG: PAS domain S-box protein [Planctomycetota bacterium]|nr:MAG: PAS domain S-box protein [Planctomycetota bacterium]